MRCRSGLAPAGLPAGKDEVCQVEKRSRNRPGAGAVLPGRLLVVDDEESQLLLAADILTPEGHTVETALSGKEALRLLARQPFDLVVADLMMPGMDGFELLKEIGASWPDLPVIFLTAHADVSSAVAAIKEGAENYLTKPFDIERLRITVARALEKKALRDDNVRLRTLMHRRRSSLGALIGGSEAMQAVYDQIERVAPTSTTILLLGESGTGKDVTAGEIHRHSPRREGPFVAVNCGAIPANLLESELFGHCRGAFTGATSSKDGLFEAAGGGTIFLDEIGATSAGTQKSLLRVLQERRIRRVGETGSRPVDVRVLAATNADLDAAMRAGSFRADLYFRLSGVIIRLPPLRRREGDIPLLAEHFLAGACRRQEKKPHQLSPRAMERLQMHSWPGNIRELENVLERAVIFAPRKLIGPGDLALPEAAAERLAADGALSLESVIRSHLARILEKCAGNKAQAARILRIPRTSLYKQLKRYGIE
ncbi:MAG: sigma-54-dependent transcriptional regulator [Acidobacteriota bacterium]